MAVSRIRAIANIHDSLQLNGSADTVDLGALIEKMCRSLHAMAGGSQSIKINVAPHQTIAPLCVAQPVALVVNELVTNALRHAFPGEREGAILVTLCPLGGQLRLVVADDGVGLSPEYLDGLGYGMKLVKSMVEKVGGNFAAQNSGGACFTLDLPLKAPARCAAL